MCPQHKGSFTSAGYKPEDSSTDVCPWLQGLAVMVQVRLSQMLQQTKMYQGQQRAAVLLLLPLPHRLSLPALQETATRGLQLLLEWKAAQRQLRFCTAHGLPLQGLHSRPQQ